MSADANTPGYGCPPSGTRFKKGQSGNPKGRPKGSRNLSTAILAAANERVTIVENGRRKTITKLEAATKQLANKAASGNERAMQMLYGLMQLSEGRLPEMPRGALASDEDSALMATLVQRFSGELARIENIDDRTTESVGPVPVPEDDSK